MTKLTLENIEERRVAFKMTKRALAKAAGMNYVYLLQVYMHNKRGKEPTRSVLLKLDDVLPKREEDYRLQVQSLPRTLWLKSRAEAEGVTVDELVYQLVGEVLSRGKGTRNGTTSQMSNTP